MLKNSELAALSALYASWTDDRATPKFVADARQIIARLESAEAALRKCRDTAIGMDDTAWQMTERHFDQVKG